MGVNCSSSRSDLSPAARHADEESEESDKIKRCDELLQSARALRDQGDYEASLTRYVEALRLRSEVLGLNENGRETMTFMRRLSVAAGNSKEKRMSPSVSQGNLLAAAAAQQQQQQERRLFAKGPTPSSSLHTPMAEKSDTSDLDRSHDNNNNNASSAPARQEKKRKTKKKQQSSTSAPPSQRTRTHHAKSPFAPIHRLPSDQQQQDHNNDDELDSSTSTLGSHSAMTITKPRPFFHAHVSLLNEIGNLHLRLGNLHVAFFYYYETISILAPVMQAAAHCGIKQNHSGLPAYVDAMIGIVLVYISLAEAVGLQAPPGALVRKPSISSGADEGGMKKKDVLNSPDDIAAGIMFAFQEMMPMQMTHYLPLTVLPSNEGAAGSESPSVEGKRTSVSGASTMDVSVEALAKWGIDSSRDFRSSVAELATKLKSAHPLELADLQLQEAAQTIQVCDSKRSVHLIPIMHMQCRIAVIMNEKRLALHLMQKCLGLTYWYRHGASDAYALAVYSHRALSRIREAIRRDDAAVKIQRWYWHRVDKERARRHYEAEHASPHIAVREGIIRRHREAAAAGKPEPQPDFTPKFLVQTNTNNSSASSNSVHPTEDKNAPNVNVPAATPNAAAARAAGPTTVTTSVATEGHTLVRKFSYVQDDNGDAKDSNNNNNASPHSQRPTPSGRADSTSMFAPGGFLPDQPATVGDRSQSGAYQLPALKDDDDDDADDVYATRNNGFDDDDDEDEDARKCDGGEEDGEGACSSEDDDDAYRPSRTSQVLRSKENVVDAIAALFQTMQETVANTLLLPNSNGGRGRVSGRSPSPVFIPSSPSRNTTTPHQTLSTTLPKGESGFMSACSDGGLTLSSGAKRSSSNMTRLTQGTNSFSAQMRTQPSAEFGTSNNEKISNSDMNGVGNGRTSTLIYTLGVEHVISASPSPARSPTQPPEDEAVQPDDLKRTLLVDGADTAAATTAVQCASTADGQQPSKNIVNPSPREKRETSQGRHRFDEEDSD